MQQRIIYLKLILTMAIWGGAFRRMTTIRELKSHIDLKAINSNAFRCSIKEEIINAEQDI